MKQNLYLFSNTILRRKQNTLYLEAYSQTEPSHQADIDEEAENVLLIGKDNDVNVKQHKFIPAHNVEAIYTFGEVKLTTGFLSCAAYNCIPVHVFNFYGNYLGTFLPKSDISSGNIALQQAEHFADEQKRLAIAKKFISGAAQNSISNLKYYSYRGADLNNEINQLEIITSLIGELKTIGSLLGVEGNIKNSYYICWKKFLKQDVEFEKRVKRPPDNIINSLISFGNVMLYSVCLNEIFRTGLIPSIGFLHSPGDNRLPLSFDIAEIFKPVITDKVIFRVINTGIIDENDFNRKGDLLYMKEKAKRKFVDEFEKRIKTTILHPSLKRSVSYRTIIRLECYNLINYLKNGQNYLPFKSSS
jgi:CRISPR-associated protein Cas1